MATDVYVGKLEAIKEEAGLSRQEIAEIVGTSSRTVVRWATGQAVPRGTPRERLLELSVIAQLAAKVMRPDAVSPWLYAPNPLLDFARPVDLVASGAYREVVGAIQAIGEGVFV